jgi:hypothetical protein
MRAVGVEDPSAPVVAPEEHQVAIQVSHGPHIPLNQPLGEAGNG